MTIVVKEYTSKSGTIYQLKEFDKTRIYHSSEVRSTKANNAEYWDAIAKDKKLEQMQEAESKKVKPLSDDEKFAIAVARQKQKDQEKQDYEARELAKVKAHEDYLNSTPELATISTTSFYIYTLEVHQWMSKGYQLVVESLNCLAPSYFEATLTAPASKSKK